MREENEPHAFLPCTNEDGHLFPIDHPHCAIVGCGRPPDDPIHSVDVEGEVAAA